MRYYPILSSSPYPPQEIADLRDVLVAAAGKIDDHQVVLRPLWGELHHLSNGMCGLERRDDAFQPRQKLKGCDRLVVGRGQIFDTPDLVQPGMFRADAG